MNIFWFRRDLRLNDNTGLFHALNSAEEVLPFFVFDTNILSQLPKNDARVTFIHNQLEQIQTELNSKGKSLAIFYGKPFDIFRKLIAENKIKTVFHHLTKDELIEKLLANQLLQNKVEKDKSIKAPRRSN